MKPTLNHNHTKDGALMANSADPLLAAALKVQAACEGSSSSTKPEPVTRMVSVRGIRPIVREPVLTPQELAAVPSDKRTIEPLLTLEQEIALMAQMLGAEVSS